jgi:hypothetical protein
MAYVVNNFQRWPSKVRERFMNLDPRNKFFKLDVSAEKYTMINFSENYGTWEFRLFGNIQSENDARRCLLLAIEALRHAYRVAVNTDAPIISDFIQKEQLTAGQACTAMDRFLIGGGKAGLRAYVQQRVTDRVFAAA